MNPQPLALETKVLPIELSFLSLLYKITFFMRKIQLSIYYFNELNYRMLYAFIGILLLFLTTYTYKQTLIFIILPKGLSHFVTAGLTEIFFTYMHLCTVISFSFGFILIILQIFFFLQPGLYLYEYNAALNTIVAIILSYFIIYLIIFPILVKYLWEVFSTYSQNFTPIHLTFEPRLIDYLKHVENINKILIIICPFGLILSLFQRYSTKKIWIKYRGLAYIITFSIAAFITPPDIVSQTLVGLPLILFYELQIIIWAIYKKYQSHLLIWQPVKTYKNSLGYKE